MHIDCSLKDLPTLDDSFFGLTTQGVFLNRNVEMYQNYESSRRSCQKQQGGGERCVTHYSYGKKWGSSPINSDTFKGPQLSQRGSELVNPSDWPVSSQSWKAPELHAGAFTLPNALVGRITNSKPMTLSALPKSLETVKNPRGVAEWRLHSGGAYFSSGRSNRFAKLRATMSHK